MATTFAVCNFPLGFQGTEQCQFLVLSWGASRALHRVNKAKESSGCWAGSLAWASGGAALGFSPSAVLCLSPQSSWVGGDRAGTAGSAESPVPAQPSPAALGTRAGMGDSGEFMGQRVFVATCLDKVQILGKEGYVYDLRKCKHHKRCLSLSGLPLVKLLSLISQKILNSGFVNYIIKYL